MVLVQGMSVPKSRSHLHEKGLSDELLGTSPADTIRSEVISGQEPLSPTLCVSLKAALYVVGSHESLPALQAAAVAAGDASRDTSPVRPHSRSCLLYTSDAADE